MERPVPGEAHSGDIDRHTNEVSAPPRVLAMATETQSVDDIRPIDAGDSKWVLNGDMNRAEREDKRPREWQTAPKEAIGEKRKEEKKRKKTKFLFWKWKE
jgi:hypothetical protein